MDIRVFFTDQSKADLNLKKLSKRQNVKNLQKEGKKPF